MASNIKTFTRWPFTEKRADLCFRVKRRKFRKVAVAPRQVECLSLTLQLSRSQPECPARLRAATLRCSLCRAGPEKAEANRLRDLRS